MAGTTAGGMWQGLTATGVVADATTFGAVLAVPILLIIGYKVAISLAGFVVNRFARR